MTGSPSASRRAAPERVRARPDGVAAASGTPGTGGELATDVEEVMVHLVRGVDRHPTQRPFHLGRVVVDDATIPVGGVETAQDLREHRRRVGYLAGHGSGVLLRVAVVLDALVTAHGVERRSIDPPGGEHPL